MIDPGHPRKRRVRRAFGQAAATYEQAAALQRSISDHLLASLDDLGIRPSTVLDAGAGTGYGTAALRARYRRARIIALDLAEAMLLQTRKRHPLPCGPDHVVCADAESLPFKNTSVELIFSGSMLQWCGEPACVFSEFRRVLRPSGQLAFATFGPATLRELRASWQTVDARVHVNTFPREAALRDSLTCAGFAEPRLERAMISLAYREVRDLLLDLKQLGANQTAGHKRPLTGRGPLRRMIQAYEQYRTGGWLPVSYEVIYGYARAPLDR